MSELFTYYGVCCALALLATLLVAGIWYRLRGLAYGTWIRLCLLAVPLAWLCSRLAFCLANIPYYFITVENPALMLRFRDGGYSLFGALGGLMLAAFLTAKRERIHPGMLLDGIGLGAPLGAFMERLAQTGTGTGWGDMIESDWLLPLGVTENRWHPVYLYEAMAALLLLLALVLWLRSRGGRVPSGDLLLVFLTLYGCVQVVLENLAKDGHMVVHHFVHINQIIAVVLPVAALVVWTVRLVKKGVKKGQIISIWLVTAAMIGIAVNQDFAVDRGSNQVLDYGIMAAAMVVIAIGALYLRRKAEA